MMLSLFKSDSAWSSRVLRLTLGLVMFPHGAQKLLGGVGHPMTLLNRHQRGTK